MKYINLFTILVGCLIFAASCSDKSVPVKKDAELKSPAVGDHTPGDVASSTYGEAPASNNGAEIGEVEEDCHGKRAVTQTIQDVDASILKVGDRYVISMNDGTNRYNPCEIPKMLKVGGMLIRFSGEVLEIRPGERLIATPFRLKSIVEREK